MLLLIAVIAVVVLVLLGLVVAFRLNVGNSKAIDGVRRTDSKAAARLEQQRAEHGLRGSGAGGIGGGGF